MISRDEGVARENSRETDNATDEPENNFSKSPLPGSPGFFFFLFFFLNSAVPFFRTIPRMPRVLQQCARGSRSLEALFNFFSPSPTLVQIPRPETRNLSYRVMFARVVPPNPFISPVPPPCSEKTKREAGTFVRWFVRGSITRNKLHLESGRKRGTERSAKLHFRRTRRG